MSSILKTYSVQYKGLKLGKHFFEFEITDRFFEEFPEGEISKGNLIANVSLDKHSTMLEFFIDIEGNVVVLCDRCLEPLELPIEFSGRLIVKFGEETSTDDDELWTLSENEFEVNLAHYLYESISLSLPISRYHGIGNSKEEDCNPEMLKKIGVKNIKVKKASKEVDPRWEQLRNLLDN